ncbi:hypothetical protein K1T71_006983 [Dendrolimus kikuchii]|uniref:Uncharacterized protein n=1 Tax=Dendrolimus kikuchii TaxID=765133 RepID=A0ACC1CZ51_9NEOP|nr:hypothetical protein K1T71_006983 [Dendrolimus kikuchii]
MSYMTLIYLLSILCTEASARNRNNSTNIDENGIAIKNVTIIEYTKDNEAIYNETDEFNNASNKDINTEKPNYINSDDNKKCDVVNGTEVEEHATNILDSIYLNNVYSSVTANLIGTPVNDMVGDGDNLYDLVKADCGGAKSCAAGNKSEKTVTVGFLSAYRRIKNTGG